MGKLAWNREISLHPFDSAATAEMVLCEVPGGKKLGRYAVPADVLRFATRFDGTRDTAELIAEYCAESPTRTPAQLSRLVNDFLAPRGLLVDVERPAAEPTGEPAAESAPWRRSLGVRVTILPARVVVPIGKAFGWLFTPVAAPIALSLIVLAHVWFYASVRPHELKSQTLLPGDALAIMLLVSLGSLIHELGHASAGVRYGCRSIRIGWGIYFYFNVLFADLSEAWRLPRRQRAVVDLGGIYFQLLFLVGVAVVHMLTGTRELLYVFLFTDFAVVTYLSPFLRLDGYWLFSDLLGIANLREQSVLLLRRGGVLLARLVGVRLPLPGRWSLSRTPTTILAVYTVASLAFFWTLWLAIIRGFGTSLFVNYPEVLARLAAAATEPPVSWGRLAGAVFDVFWRTTAAIGISLMVLSVLPSVLRASVRFAAALRTAVFQPGAARGNEA